MDIPMQLSRRERQVMDILFRAGQATAAEVLAELPDAPGYSGVRTILRVLEHKGHLVHDVRDRQYVYRPATSERTVRQAALRHLVSTFFQGRPERVATAVLSGSRVRLTTDEADELRRLIDRAEQRD